MHTIAALNEQFGIPDQVEFEEGPGGFTFIRILTTSASASLTLQGGQVLYYQPTDQLPVLWVSEQSLCQPGKAMRGGIPVCWPWFGPHPEDPSKPAHGFARTSVWEPQATETLADGVRITLVLVDNEQTRALWPHTFVLQLMVDVGAQLRVALAITNTSDVPFRCSGALHSYFSVSDISTVSVSGLEGHTYIDQIDGNQRKQQADAITISSETDRIYLNTNAPAVIHDPQAQRHIQIAAEGSHSTVVWNPWIEKSQRMADFGDEEYHGMLCVETANAADDAVTVAPGATHDLVAIIGVETIS